jgi:hypothetical protein
MGIRAKGRKVGMGERQEMTFEEQDGEGRVVKGRNMDEGKNGQYR